MRLVSWNENDKKKMKNHEGLFSSLNLSQTRRGWLFSDSKDGVWHDWSSFLPTDGNFLFWGRKSFFWAYRSGLSLSNQISSHHGWLDSSLLDSRGLFETVRVDTTEKLFRQLHTIKGFNCFVPVGIEVGISQASFSWGCSSFFCWSWLFGGWSNLI